MDWCKYFAGIEADPTAIPPRITVRQLWEGREHLQNCDNCSNRMDRVEAMKPKEDFPKQGLN